MYVGVKLINYPHLYYFSHFTHFTLYLRKCEKYQILFNFVLISKFPISIMETSTLFPRHLEKHKFLLRSIEGVAFLTRDIGNYPCLTEASTADHYSTTCLKFSSANWPTRLLFLKRRQSSVLSRKGLVEAG